jgi:hypothetical protein
MRGVKELGTYKAMFAETEWWKKAGQKCHE